VCMCVYMYVRDCVRVYMFEYVRVSVCAAINY
jgi:hypothetical protein